MGREFLPLGIREAIVDEVNRNPLSAFGTDHYMSKSGTKQTDPIATGECLQFIGSSSRAADAIEGPSLTQGGHQCWLT